MAGRTSNPTTPPSVLKWATVSAAARAIICFMPRSLKRSAPILQAAYNFLGWLFRLDIYCVGQNTDAATMRLASETRPTSSTGCIW